MLVVQMPGTLQGNSLSIMTATDLFMETRKTLSNFWRKQSRKMTALLPILSQPGCSACLTPHLPQIGKLPFGLLYCLWYTLAEMTRPRRCIDGLCFGERVPYTLLISRKRKRAFRLFFGNASPTVPSQHAHPISCSLASSAYALCVGGDSAHCAGPV